MLTLIAFLSSFVIKILDFFALAGEWFVSLAANYKTESLLLVALGVTQLLAGSTVERVAIGAVVALGLLVGYKFGSS